MQTNADAWKALTATQRQGWNDFGLNFARNDALGQAYNLTGFQAYCSVNNYQLAAGNAVLADAPVYSPPAPLTSITPTATSASLSLAYTATPLPAGARIFWSLSPCRSAGRSYESDMRLINVTAAAAASPTNVLASYQARFGNPVTGTKIFISGQVYLNGMLSQPLTTSIIVS